MVPKLLLITILGVQQFTLVQNQKSGNTTVTEKSGIDSENQQKYGQKLENRKNESDNDALTFRYGYSIIGKNDSVDQRSEYQWGTNTLGNYFVQLPESKSKVEYTADNSGFHPIVRFEVKNNHSELTSHFALGDNAVNAINDEKSNRIVTVTPTVTNFETNSDNKNKIEFDNTSFDIKKLISSSKDNIKSNIIKKSDENLIEKIHSINKNSQNDDVDVVENDKHYGDKIQPELIPITSNKKRDNEYAEDDEDSLNFFNKSFRDIFKNRITEYISNASKSHSDIFKTSKAVPHMNEVFHYFDVHPVSDSESDYRENKTEINPVYQNNYQEEEDFNTYQSVRGLDNWITEYLEGTRPPEIYSNNNDDLQALPTYISHQVKNNSTEIITKKPTIINGDLIVDKVTDINEQKQQQQQEQQNRTNGSQRIKDIVTEFTGFISDEDVLNINDAAEEFNSAAETEQKSKETFIYPLIFLPTINSILEDMTPDNGNFINNSTNNTTMITPKTAIEANYTFLSPIIVHDNLSASNESDLNNSTEEYYDDNIIADTNSIQRNAYYNSPNEVEIIQSREKFINIPKFESTKQINVEIIKELKRNEPSKKPLSSVKDLDASHENEERNFSKEYLGPISEAPSRKFLKSFNPKYDENRIDVQKITDFHRMIRNDQNLVATPNKQYITLPPPYYSTTEKNWGMKSTTSSPQMSRHFSTFRNNPFVSSTTQSTRTSRGKTFVEIQKSVNVHNMLIQEQDGKLIGQHEEYRKPYNYGEKIINIDTQPQKITHSFSTIEPIAVYDNYQPQQSVMVSHPGEGLPKPVDKGFKGFSSDGNSLPIYVVSSPSSYFVEEEKGANKSQTEVNNLKTSEDGQKEQVQFKDDNSAKNVETQNVEIPANHFGERYVERPHQISEPTKNFVETQSSVHSYVSNPNSVQISYYTSRPYLEENKPVDNPVEKNVQKEDPPLQHTIPVRLEISVERPHKVEPEKPLNKEVDKVVVNPVETKKSVQNEKFVERPVSSEKSAERPAATVENIFNKAILIPVQVPYPYITPTAPTYNQQDFNNYNDNFFGKINALHTDYNLPIVGNHYPTTELYTLLQPTPPHQNALNFYNQPSVPIHYQQQSFPVTIVPKRPGHAIASKYPHPSHAIIQNVRYAKNFNYKPLIPVSVIPHSIPKLIANDYIGPVPAESEKSFWILSPGVGSRGLYKRSPDFEKNLRLEYGFKPPLVPSVEIDDQGKPIEKKD